MENCNAEAERLRKLAELVIVEAPVDPLMERICALACSLLSTPMAFVTFIDATLTHVKAHHGLATVRLPREETFCDVAIRQDEPLIVPDLAEDPRFADNKLVVGEPGFRFYAGVPLALSPGVRVGAFCVGDVVPRELGPAQIECLQNLAGLALGQIRHHASRQELARQAIELSRKQTILSQTAQLARVGGFELDPDTDAFAPSDELCRLVAAEPGRTRDLEAFLDLFGAEACTSLREGFARLREAGGILDLEAIVPLRRDGLLHVRVHAETQATPDGRRIVGIVQDISERKAAIGRLEWLATHDGLTKLCNREAFTDRIEAAIRRADASGRRVALMIIDLDRFKTINDTLGHDAGDAALVAVAERLLAAVGRRATVSRIGGDEFGVLAGEIDSESTLATLAADILRLLRRPLMHQGYELSTRATLGIALSELDESNAASLFKDADIALYEAKKAGRDGFALFRPSMREALATRMAKLVATRAIVAADRLEPWYQPKLDLATGAVVGFEALLRHVDASDGARGAESLGEALADPELACTIGRLVRRRVALDIAQWRRRGIAFGHVAINVAEAEFQDDFAESFVEWLEREGLAPAMVEIEVTERAIMGHYGAKVARALDRLAGIGVAIALDDFGTGYASLTHLRCHPIHRVKIDRSIVDEIETCPRAAGMVEAVVSLARRLGAGVVAEGVETTSQLDVLRAAGCEVGQGFLFAKAMPGSRVPHFLRTAALRDDAPRRALCG